VIRLIKSGIVSVLLLSLVAVTPAAAANQGVVMNFSDVDIATMVKFISELTGKNFVLDERVKGKVSVFSPSRLSTDEAFALFTSVLELKGFTLVQTGKVYKVLPTAGAKQSGMKLSDSARLPLGDAFMARVFPLEQISSQEALTFLQPIVSKEGHIGSFGPGNMLLVVDAASNLQKVADILALIDTPQRREGAELLYLKHGSAEGVAKVLQDWLSGRGPRQAAGALQQASSGSVQVLADSRLNAILLFGPEKDKEGIRSLVKQLDVLPPEASSKINVYYLEHTDATEMAKVLDGVVKGITASAGPGVAAATAGLSPLDSGKVTITPDKATNSLVIMAAPNDYSNLLQVVKKLDRRSKQVFVQVLIAEVSLDKSREVGMQSGVIGGAALNKYLAVAGMYDPMGTFGSLLNSINNTPIANSIIEARPVNITAMMKALDKNGLVNILSTPNILTTDNKEAEINVGENVPFKGSTTSLAGSSTATYESIERKDIGINLKIKPQISEGDYIRMDIYQEISAVKNDKGQAVDLVTTKRSAKTSVVVKDNETIVIGGLIQDTEDTNIEKVPLLGDIPGLGWLFKTSTKTRKKTNLMILLTPQVVKDARDMTAITDQQRDTFTEATKKPARWTFRKRSVTALASRPKNRRSPPAMATDHDLQGLAERLGLPFQEQIDDALADETLLSRLPLAFARSRCLLPLAIQNGQLLVAVGNPADLLAQDEVAKLYGLPVSGIVVPQEELLAAINRLYSRTAGSARDVVENLIAEDLSTIATELSRPHDLLDLTDEAPVIRLLHAILFQAVKERASDIHIEPYERSLEVRFRIDGILHLKLEPPKVVQEALVSRVKIMASLNIAEKRLPQDGRLKVLVAGHEVDVRVSIVPTFFGERTVLRLLDRKQGVRSLGAIGFSERDTTIMERLLSRSNGIILVTGPTGSGKTTTLYAAISRLNRQEKTSSPLKIRLNINCPVLVRFRCRARLI